MSRDAVIPLVFATMFLPPLALGRVSGIVWRLWRPWHGRSAEQATVTEAWRANRPVKADWPAITEFARRRDRFNKFILAAAFAGFCLWGLGLPLTGSAIFLLLPLYGAILHLRCPACESSTTLRGVSDGKYCLRCRNRIRY